MRIRIANKKPERVSIRLILIRKQLHLDKRIQSEYTQQVLFKNNNSKKQRRRRRDIAIINQYFICTAILKNMYKSSYILSENRRLFMEK